MLNRKRASANAADAQSMTWVLPGLQQDQAGFAKISEYLKRVAGINLPLNDKNLMLMAGRLNPVFRHHGISSYGEYLKLLKKNDPVILHEFVSALTTNTTEFFRENEHFEILRGLIPQLLAKKGSDREIRVWCAAASTGQEPWTIAMTLKELMADHGSFTIKMLATDIDAEVLHRAMEGIYSDDEVSGVPSLLRQKYFTQVADRPCRKFQVSKELRDTVQYAQFNLLTEPYPFKYPFDVVFCRNVLIYFDRATAENVVAKLIRSLSLGSYLFVGHSETGMMRSATARSVANAVYQRKS